MSIITLFKNFRKKKEDDLKVGDICILNIPPGVYSLCFANGQKCVISRILNHTYAHMKPPVYFITLMRSTLKIEHAVPKNYLIKVKVNKNPILDPYGEEDWD